MVNFTKNVKKIVSETIRWIKLILFIHTYDIILYIKYVSCFNVRLELWLLWQLFSFLWLYLTNSQVSVYRTIGPSGYSTNHVFQLKQTIKDEKKFKAFCFFQLSPIAMRKVDLLCRLS